MTPAAKYQLLHETLTALLDNKLLCNVIEGEGDNRYEAGPDGRRMMTCRHERGPP
jgi:hypothetical protein